MATCGPLSTPGVVIDPSETIEAAATAALRARQRGEVRMFHRNGYFGPLVEPA